MQKETANFYRLKLIFIKIEKRILLIKNQKKIKKENFKFKFAVNEEKIYLENLKDQKKIS